MRSRTELAWIGAFVAAVAALALFVFWGTWSPDAAPVMPDCPVWHPVDWFAARLRAWSADGKLIPDDFLKLIGGPYVWQELQYVLAIGCSGLALAYFLRGRGLAPLAAYGSGLLLAFSGYWFSLFSAGHLGWFQWMTYGVFAFGLVDRAVEGSRLRHWALLGACLAWGSMRQPDLWLLFTVFTAAYFLYRTIVVSRRRRAVEPKDAGVFWRGWIAGSAVALAVLLMIGLVSFRSAIVNDLSGRDRQIAESGSSATGGDAKAEAGKRWEFVTNWSLPPEDTLEFVCPRIRGDTSCQMVLHFGGKQGTGVMPYTGRLGRPLNAPADRVVNYRQHSLYVGLITCLLALIGVVSGILRSADVRHRGEIVFFFVSGVVFYLFSLGRFCEPVYRLVYALPMGDYLRAPVKWHHLTEFCIAVLSGFGVDFLLRRFGVVRKWVLPALAAVILAGAVDLARVNRLYCGAMDLSVVRAPNAAAEAVNREPGAMLDLVERGQGFTAWSFQSRGVAFASGLDDARLKYIWAPVRLLREQRFVELLRGCKARISGWYSISPRGIAATSDSVRAQAVLFTLPKSVPPAPAPDAPSDRVTRMLAILSLVGTLTVGGWGIAGGLRR